MKKTNPHDRKRPRRTRSAAAAAKKIAAGYRLVFEPIQDGGFVGRALELPGVMADGRSLLECVRATTFAVTTAVEAMLENGLQPPSSGRAANRTEQVNVRLTPDEKASLLEDSARKGFRGLSEYLRSLALDVSA